MNIEDGLAQYVIQLRAQLLPLVNALAAAAELQSAAAAFAEKHGRQPESLDSLFDGVTGEIERAHLQSLLNRLEESL